MRTVKYPNVFQYKTMTSVPNSRHFIDVEVMRIVSLGPRGKGKEVKCACSTEYHVMKKYPVFN